jgi:hypothetical protein
MKARALALTVCTSLLVLAPSAHSSTPRGLQMLILGGGAPVGQTIHVARRRAAIGLRTHTARKAYPSANAFQVRRDSL